MITGAQPGFFRGMGGFLEKGHFNKRFMYDIKKDPSEKILMFFLQDTLKTTF